MGMFTFYNNFTAGEVSPRIYPRIDLVQRKNGAKTLLNALPTVHGGWIGRPGTRFVCRTKYTDKVTRLVPFKFSVDQTYTIEVGHLYMRFITQGGRLEETAKTITSAVNNGAGLVRLTSSGHGFLNGDHIAIRNVLGTYEANGDWDVTNVTASTFDLVDSVFAHAYTSGGTASRIIEIVSPYAETDLDELNYTPDSDLLYFVHPSFKPKVLTRLAATTFTIGDLSLIGGPFNDLNADDTLTMTSSLTTIGSARTLTASAAFFTAAMVGHLFRFGGTTGSPAVQGYGKITAVGGPTAATWDIIQTLSSVGPTASWALGAFGTATGYPIAVTWFDQRLVFLGTDTQEQTGWGSATTRVLDFSIGVAASDAITFSIRTDEINRIVWGASSTDLLIGTIGGEHKITGGNNEAITPTNIRARQQTAYGSKNVRPVKAGDLVVFVQRGGNRIRQVYFNFDKDRYISPDLSLLAEHLFRKPNEVEEMTFQLQPDPLVWFVMSDGTYRTCTLLPDNNVAGFAQHSFDNASMLSVVSLPQSNLTDDETYCLVERTINSKVVQYIEVFDYALNVDCGLSASFGTPSGSLLLDNGGGFLTLENGGHLLLDLETSVSTIRGLEHLEGTTVAIVGDGTEYNSKVVTANSATISDGEDPIFDVQIGIPFVPTCTLLSPEFETAQGPTFGKKKHFAKVLIFTNDTAVLTLNGETAAARSITDLMDVAPTIDADGVFQFTTFGNSEQLNLTITQPSPLPVSVTGVYGELSLADS